jgi:Family of unknown function (DUF5335)
VAQNTAVEQSRWGEYLSLFSNGNRGRRVSIETIDESADAPLVSKAPLLAIDYDPAGKGDDVVISLGREAIAASHVVQSPREVWEAADDNGKVIGLELVGAGGKKTILTFE